MFDSLNLKLMQERAGNSDLLAHTSVYLDNFKTIHKGTLTHYAGTFKNLNIYITETAVYISGSLAKYYLGDNIKTLCRSDTEEAINNLADELHLPIQKADVTRLDFAHNFSMQHKPEIYYNYLGESRYFHRNTKANSLSYENDSRTKAFYNKLLEAKTKHVKIPERLKGINLLRYEIRYHHKLCDKLNEPKVTASSLFNEQFYIKLVNRYVSGYKSIHKNANQSKLETYININVMDTPKDVKDQLAMIGLMAIGQNRFNELVDEWRADDILSKPEYYSRSKREMRKLADKFTGSNSNPLIEELDKKISRVKMNYR